MSTYNPAGPFLVEFHGTLWMNGAPVVCPRCERSTGLALLAAAADRPVVAKCPCRHSWPAVGFGFGFVRDTYCAGMGLPPHR